MDNIRCVHCNYEWKPIKKEHIGNWHCPKCGKIVKDPCPECGKPKCYFSKYCQRCSCKLIPRKRPSRKGIPRKNGFYIDKHKHGKTSYKLMLAPWHPRSKRRGNYVYEHILVWEKENGCYLPDDWIVHHINGNGLDNRPENLVGMHKKEHSPWIMLHIAERRIRDLESHINNLQQLHLNI